MDNEKQNGQLSVELNAGAIIGFLFPTIDYSEASEDRRKKPVLYWKSYQAYPFIQLPNDDGSFDEEMDDSTEIAIMAEGGSVDDRSYVRMTYGAFITFIRANTSFRVLDSDEIFDELNLM